MNILKRLFSNAAGPEVRRQFVWKSLVFSASFPPCSNPSGWEYAERRHVRKNSAEVLAFLDFASRFGDPIGLCCLGKFYYDGELVAPDLDRAEACLTLAYELGDLAALRDLGKVALAKQCSERRLVELADLFEAEKSRAEAISDSLKKVVGDKEYYDLRENLLLRLALAGDKEAQVELAQHWIWGRSTWSRPDNPNASKRASTLYSVAEAAALQGAVRAQWFMVDILSYQQACTEAKRTWIGRSVPLQELVSSASKQGLMWAILASRNNFQENTPESLLAIREAEAYVALMTEHCDATLMNQADRAASTEVEYVETPITRCARTTKSLLAANGGVFPKNWRELVETPFYAPQLNW